MINDVEDTRLAIRYASSYVVLRLTSCIFRPLPPESGGIAAPYTRATHLPLPCLVPLVDEFKPIKIKYRILCWRIKEI